MGGVAFSEGASVNSRDSTYFHNSAYMFGGVFYLSGRNVLGLINSSLMGNAASVGSVLFVSQ